MLEYTHMIRAIWLIGHIRIRCLTLSTMCSVAGVVLAVRLRAWWCTKTRSGNRAGKTLKTTTNSSTVSSNPTQTIQAIVVHIFSRQMCWVLHSITAEVAAIVEPGHHLALEFSRLCVCSCRNVRHEDEIRWERPPAGSSDANVHRQNDWPFR